MQDLLDSHLPLFLIIPHPDQLTDERQFLLGGSRMAEQRVADFHLLGRNIVFVLADQLHIFHLFFQFLGQLILLILQSDGLTYASLLLVADTLTPHGRLFLLFQERVFLRIGFQRQLFG